MEFSRDLIRAIQAVSQDCAADMEAPDRSNPEIVAEVTLDAGRLAMFGHELADAEMRELSSEHGWGAVVKEAAKHVYVY